jgi:hypothetical protein
VELLGDEEERRSWARRFRWDCSWQCFGVLPGGVLALLRCRRLVVRGCTNAERRAWHWSTS